MAGLILATLASHITSGYASTSTVVFWPSTTCVSCVSFKFASIQTLLLAIIPKAGSPDSTHSPGSSFNLVTIPPTGALTSVYPRFIFASDSSASAPIKSGCWSKLLFGSPPSLANTVFIFCFLVKTSWFAASSSNSASSNFDSASSNLARVVIDFFINIRCRRASLLW